MRARGQFGARHRVAALALAASLLGVGCAQLHPPKPRPGDQPFDEARVLPFASPDPHLRGLGGAARYHAKWFFLARRAPLRARPPVDKIDPALRNLLRTVSDSTVIRVVVTFTNRVPTPRFPRLDTRLPRSAPTNAHLLDSARVMIDSLRSRRSLAYVQDTTALQAYPGATVRKTFWLLQACVVDLPKRSFGLFQTDTNVVYVRSNSGNVAPGQDGDRGNDTDQACALVGTAAYFDAFGDGFMGLLDTGVRTTHVLLHAPTPLCMVADCVSGNGLPLDPAQCSAFETSGATTGGGDTYKDGHGTSTAAILAGNGNSVDPGPESRGWFRGVTHPSLDCLQVYGSDSHLRVDAALDGFELAVARLDAVIVAEMQENTLQDIADVEAAADDAYDAGLMVVAANGNVLGLGLGVPANARRAIGVGAYDILTGKPIHSQASGATADGRRKPDIMAPSYTETAGNGGNDAMREHTATSGATPYAAGAALLLENWMLNEGNGSGFVPDPGQVYAHLILSGDEVGPFGLGSLYGAGKFTLPPRGESVCGKVWVSEATREVEVPIDLPAGGVSRLSAALWWPERAAVVGTTPVDTHNDVDLEIVSPGLFGSVKARSNGGNGVFERASVSGSPVLTGQWKLRIIPYAIRTPEAQTVYWAAALVK